MDINFKRLFTALIVMVMFLLLMLLADAPMSC